MYERDKGYTTRRGHAQQPSISDETHHVTEAIGYMYEDDYEREDPRYIDPTPLPRDESTSTLSPNGYRSNSPNPSQRHQTLPVRTSSIDAGKPNGQVRQPTTARSDSMGRGGGRQLSPVLSRADSTEAATTSFGVRDIDYASDPAAVAQ
jgi:hypothetical protein